METCMTQKAKQHDETAAPPAAQNEKKTFVAPEISQPVDVLEATTFFQVADSGGTGLRKKGG